MTALRGLSRSWQISAGDHDGARGNDEGSGHDSS